VADALSRQEEGQTAEITALSKPAFSFFDDLCKQIKDNTALPASGTRWLGVGGGMASPSLIGYY
jgi:hypothetical protein